MSTPFGQRQRPWRELANDVIFERLLAGFYATAWHGELNPPGVRPRAGYRRFGAALIVTLLSRRHYIACGGGFIQVGGRKVWNFRPFKRQRRFNRTRIALGSEHRRQSFSPKRN